MVKSPDKHDWKRMSLESLLAGQERALRNYRRVLKAIHTIERRDGRRFVSSMLRKQASNWGKEVDHYAAQLQKLKRFTAENIKEGTVRG